VPPSSKPGAVRSRVSPYPLGELTRPNERPPVSSLTCPKAEQRTKLQQLTAARCLAWSSNWPVAHDQRRCRTPAQTLLVDRSQRTVTWRSKPMVTKPMNIGFGPCRR